MKTPEEIAHALDLLTLFRRAGGLAAGSGETANNLIGVMAGLAWVTDTHDRHHDVVQNTLDFIAPHENALRAGTDPTRN